MQPDSDFLKKEEGILWLETDAGKTWLASKEGKDFVAAEVLRIAALPDSAMFAELGQAILRIEKAQKQREKKNQA